MNIVVCCGTLRGAAFIRTLVQLCPDVTLTVITFPAESFEPPFADEITLAAQSVGGTVYLAENGNLDDCGIDWTTFGFDLLFAVSWRYMIPVRIYEKAARGAYVFHDSLLPENRGFAPTIWSIATGKNYTGVSLIEMSQRADEGAIVFQERVPIAADETIAHVLPRVTKAYCSVIERFYSALISGNIPAKCQDARRATHNPRRTRMDDQIIWSKPARAVHNLVRAVTRPYRGAWTTIGGNELIVWQGAVLREYGRGTPGRVCEILPGNGAIVECGTGAYLISGITTESGNECAADTILTTNTVLGK